MGQRCLKTIFPSRKATRKRKERENNIKKTLKDDPEDIEAFEAYKRGELKPLRNSRALIASARGAALNHRKNKEARVNIPMNGWTLDTIKSIAEEEGLPYQTLMSSILYKYARKHQASKDGR